MFVPSRGTMATTDYGVSPSRRMAAIRFYLLSRRQFQHTQNRLTDCFKSSDTVVYKGLALFFFFFFLNSVINYISIAHMYYHSLGLAVKGERLHKCLHYTASTLHCGRAIKNVLIFNQKYYL